MSFNDILDRHHNCRVVILPRFHKNRNELVDGLYCEDHAKLIKWLRTEHSEELQQAGVQRLDPIKQDKIKLIQKKLTDNDYLPRGGWL
jgi:hypothetical protein